MRSAIPRDLVGDTGVDITARMRAFLRWPSRMRGTYGKSATAHRGG